MFNRTTKRLFSVALTVLLALTLCGQALAETMTVFTAVDGAQVYNEDGIVIGTLAANTALTLTGLKKGICRIEREGFIAYMRKAELSRTTTDGTVPQATPAPAVQPSPEPTAQPVVKSVNAYVGVDSATVYNLMGEALGALSLNTQVAVTGMRGGVCQISYNNNTGYMFKTDLSVSPVTTVETTTFPEIAQQVQSVKGFVSTDGAMVLDSTGKLMAMLPLNTEVTVLDAKKGVCQVTVNDNIGYMRIDDLSRNKAQAEPETQGSVATTVSSTITPAKGTAVALDWSEIQKIFPKGTIAQVTDIATGLSWREVRYGGDNHADCQPLTAMDTAVLKQVFGGEWSWDRRAVFVTIDGVNYAAAINGMPHEGSSIDDNNFEGHHCMHFVNSRTHGTNEVDEKSQEAIKMAASVML